MPQCAKCLAFVIFDVAKVSHKNAVPLAEHPQSILGSSVHFPLLLTYFQLKTIRTYRQNEYA